MLRVPYVDIGQQYRDHRNEILEAVDRTLSSGQYILGDEVKKFEDRFATLSGVKHAIGVANGTDSLIMILRALGVEAGDEVITSPNSWISSASCAALIGARPVFVDVRPDQNMDPTKLESAITARTKAIIPVHLTGKMADMKPILEIARKHRVHVIEDAAQAVGASYFGHKAGSMGIAGSFSLHPLKNLNGAGDSGVITTNDDHLAEDLRLLRNHGIVSREKITRWGYNSRLDALQAAILNCRFDHLDKIVEKRRKHAAFYREHLKALVYCPEDASNCFDVYHLFVIQADKRDELKKFLQERGIETAIHYPVPVHLQECAKDLGYKRGDLPMIESQAARILSLPVHQNLTEDQLQHVVASIREFYA